MAEGLFRKLSRGRADVFSAGTSPEPKVHPLALDVLRTRFNVDTADLFPKHLDRFRGDRFDYVITVCDRTAEACPTFPGDPERIHWSFDDPTAVETEGAQRRAFELVANGLAARLRIWMALPAVHQRLDAAEEHNQGVRTPPVRI
jgi:arsenate reductase